MFGVPAKCPRCSKTVYAAEQKLAENKSWHAVCWALEFKEREAAKKAHKDATSYNKPPDVTPAYYRVADPETGEPARMETHTRDESHQAAPAPVHAAPAADAPKFCSECGRSRTAEDRFCGGCGHKLF